MTLYKPHNFFYIAVVLGFLICGVSSCYYDKEQVLYPGGNISCDSINAKFATNVKPIIQTRCAIQGCHTATAIAGGVNLENFNQVVLKAQRIKQRAVIERTMPLGGSITDSERNILQCWIDAGTPNN